MTGPWIVVYSEWSTRIATSIKLNIKATVLRLADDYVYSTEHNTGPALTATDLLNNNNALKM